MSKFREDFDYKNIVPQDYPLVHDLDFTKLSNDEWFQHHIKMDLGYTIPHKCRCGTETITSDPNKFLTIQQFQE
jgi:hypothetical protein